MRTLPSLRYHGAKTLGRSLGANADRLPAWLRRSLSRDGRPGFDDAAGR